MDAFAGLDRSKTARQMLTASGERRVIGCGKVGLHHREQRVQEAVRLEFPILSLNPGLRQRCVTPDVCPTLSGV